jgi:ubiquinone/menaquinone biosynthesis C-methylase UbiE
LDYDKTNLPASYDRGRSRSPEVLARWMEAVAELLAGDGTPPRILDLGCGTGRFSLPLRARFGPRVIGADPSLKMLRQARSKVEASAIPCVAARGEDLPLADGSVDLVFMSMVFHHLRDPARTVRECHRALRSDGSVFLRAGIAEGIPTYAQSPFFPAAVPIMERVLGRAADIVQVFRAAGFHADDWRILEQELAPTHAAYAEQLEAGGDSVLAQLDPSEMEAGLAALRAYAREIDPRPVTEVIDFFYFTKGG